MLLQLLTRERRPKEPGLAPGTPVYAGVERKHTPRIRVYRYSATSFEEHELASAADCAGLVDPDRVLWVDVDGVHDVQLVEEISRIFGVHPLTIEDIVNTNQRPKLDEYPEYLYIVLKMLHYEHHHCHVEAEQVSMIVGDRFVLSFQEAKEGDAFEPVRNHLRSGRGRVRRFGADFLAYSLIDVVVDYYLHVLEGVGEHIERLEDEAMTRPAPDLLRRTNHLRRLIVFLRRSIWPLGEVINSLQRTEVPFMSPEHEVYFRDISDHTARTLDLIETSRETVASIVELHLSSLSMHMNEIMKVLAIISTFFLPLTFIAGIYGMNFRPEASPLNMPELNWYYGYPFALAVMALFALTLFLFFKRKGWM